MPSIIQKANLPMAPFDGQEFIDFRRIKWKFDKEMNGWRLIGPVPEVPVATTEISGLLRAKDKLLLDTMPPKAGGFGILAQPLLSVVPLKKKALYKGKVHRASVTPSGSKIAVASDDGTEDIFESDLFAGKMIYFTSGTLKSQYFLVFTNDGNAFYVMGDDASVAARNDKFEIYDSAAINENGVIQGPIELVSETIDITCVDGKGNPIEPGTCNVNFVLVDDPANPPGLDFKVNEKFKRQFCVVQPGAAGSRGDIGDRGPAGLDGTGDGPIGDTGPAGIDAPEIGGEFTGIKIVDLDDIYDSAVVAMELDSAAGQLHVVKAKIRTPDDSKPADQVVASAINRDLRFIDPQFGYEIIMPSSDPVGIADVEIMHYPQGFKPLATTDQNVPTTTEANVIKLSVLVNSMTKFYDNELARISKEIDEKQIKPFIELKDKEARDELNARADEVARCEWEMPIEFCLGISPENCGPVEPKVKPFPLAASILGPEWSDAVAIPLPPVTVPVTPVPPPTDTSTPSTPSTPGTPPGLREPTDPVPPTTTDYAFPKDVRPEYPTDYVFTKQVSRPRVTTITESATLTNVDGTNTLIPAGYIFIYGDGAGRTAQSTWTSEVSIAYADEAGNSGTVSITDADEAMLSFDRASFIASQSAAQDSITATGFVLEAAGEASLSLAIEGTDPRGSVVIYPYQVFRNALGAPMEITQVMNRAPDGSGGMAMVTGFSGDMVGETDCPACPDCGDMTVDCGDVNCPECSADVVAASATPDSGAALTSITITGSGFGSSTGQVLFQKASGGSSVLGVVTSWSATQIVVNAPSLGSAGSANVTINTSAGETATFPNMWEQV